MLYVSANIGTYSIKFLNFKIEKKVVNFLASKEVVLDSDEFNVMEEDVVTDLQLNIIYQYLKEIEEEYKLILNAPNDIITARFLELPIANKKKAQMMVPFQLEEEIPFSLSQSHISSTIRVKKDNSYALANICREETYEKFFNKISQYKILPKILTSEVSVLENYIYHNQEILPQAFCILDIGHNTTHGYFFVDKELKAIHTSYIAGFTINEAICDAYSITSEEATIYKHQNCFFLTEDQYSKVNDVQQTFAHLMHKTFEPFLNEFKRWHVGFRVKNGIPISDIFIIGGSSNIKNIDTYLSEQLGIAVKSFDSFKNCVSDKIDNDIKQRCKFALSNIMAQSYIQKSEIINFLHGRFTIQGKINFPIHSFSFIATRVFTIMLLLIISLVIERFFINRDIASIDLKLKAMVENPILEIAPRDRRKATLNPKTVLNKLKREKNAIIQEIKTLQASIKINALKPLEIIAHLIKGLDIEVVQFQSISGGDFTAVLQAKDPATITQVDEILKKSDIKNLFTEKNIAKRTFTISGSED